MITIPVEDLVFVVCTFVGGALLLITVLVDDVLGGILDALNVHFEIGGISLMPLALSFIAMFGVGGLFATQILDLHGGAAALVGAISGTAGALLAWGLFTAFKRSEAPSPFAPSDLVGLDALVSVAIPARRWGSIQLTVEGQLHQFPATAAVDVDSGLVVRISGVAGSGLMVAPVEEVSTVATPVGSAATPPTQEEPTQGG
jgi:membrane protein implicated in regulation of membrane protease activity